MPNSVKVIARLLWFAPLLLFLLAINQARVAVDLRETLNSGARATAVVTDFDKVDRADVTYGYVSLEVPMADGSTLVKEKLTLPYTLLPHVAGQESLEVLVLPGSQQEVVIASIAQTQWKIAAIQAAMAFGACILFGLGVNWWNRYLAREGDPAYREYIPEAEQEPAEVASL